ncbi:MAG: ABC transporter ATP-binding protein, partial [Actinomycetes bacterium]
MISVVGPNGAGKTTLLQIVAGVVVPTTGTVRRPRSTASLLEVGSSYEPDLTGRENLQLGLAFDGVPPRARTPALIEIAEFADLTKWLDHPIKHYSDGMIARLSAAQAVHRDVDLLLMDEAMSVGDASFERHLMRRVDEMRRRGTIVLVATHSLSLARQADRSIWLRSGSVVGDGPSLAVLRDYELSAGSGRVAAETPRAKFLSVSALPTVVEPGHRLTVSSELEILQPCDDLSLRIELRPVIGEEQWMRPI